MEKKKAPDYLKDDHLTPLTKEFLKVLNSGGKPVESLPVPEGRKVLEGAQSAAKVDVSGIEEADKTVEADGMKIKLKVVRPKGAKGTLPVFIFIHGGGWVLGDYPTHKRLVRDIVVETGFASVFVDYSHSPEVKFPVAVNEVYAAAKWVAEHGDEIDVDGSRLAVVGNSAGGNMSIVTAMKAKKEKGPKIKAVVAMWPVTDSNLEYESGYLYAEQRFLTRTLMEWMTSQYAGSKKDLENPYFAPIKAPVEDLKGLPPMLIQVAENDILRDQGEAFGRKLSEAGVDAVTIRYNGIIHDWGMLNGFAGLPETRALIEHAAATLKKFV